MAAALHQALSQPAPLAAREFAGSFTEERTAAAYQALFESLLHAPRSRSVAQPC